MDNNKQIKDKTIYIILAIILIVLFSWFYISTNKTKANNTSNYNNTYQNNTTSNEYTKTPKKEVIVEDFSNMSKDSINNWCKQNNVKGIFSEEYSSEIDKGSFIRQSIPANSTIHEDDKITIYYSLGKAPTLGEKNALKTAKSYLDTMAFSYKGLIKQLKYEGYSDEESTYAVDNCNADWNQQAAKCAKSYIETMAFSRSSLIKQLIYEGFTDEQAEYGVSSVGY